MATRNQKTQTPNENDIKTGSGRKPRTKTSVKVTVEPTVEETAAEPTLEDNDAVDDSQVFMDDDNVKNINACQNFMNQIAYDYPIDVIVGPDGFGYPYPQPVGVTKFRSNYFRAIAKKATEIINALIDNCMYVGSKKMDALILSQDGQFVLFSNEDRCLKDRFINLNAYLPYMHNGKVNVIEYGSTQIEGPDYIKDSINNTVLPMHKKPPFVTTPAEYYQGNMMEPYGMQLMPPQDHPLQYLTKTRLTVYDYINGLARNEINCSTKPTRYKPVCIWNMTYVIGATARNDSNFIAPISWLMPETVALELLKGKAFPLIFAGSIPDNDMGVEAGNE